MTATDPTTGLPLPAAPGADRVRGRRVKSDRKQAPPPPPPPPPPAKRPVGRPRKDPSGPAQRYTVRVGATAARMLAERYGSVGKGVDALIEREMRAVT